MKWRRLLRGEPRAAGEPVASIATDRADNDATLAGALRQMEVAWLLVDAGLRVREASAATTAMFGAAASGQSLIGFSRTADIELRAREAVGGATGPWEISAQHFRKRLRMRAVPLGDQGALLYFEDLTELRHLEQVRADFVSNLAHELRTPIASLSLAAETLEGDVPPEQQQRFISRIGEETRYLQGVLRTVTELTVLEGSVQLTMTEFPLREVVEESWRRVVERQGPAELADDVDARFLVTADRVRVAEILQNLLENAHRYSPAEAPIELTAEATADGVTVRISDAGPGIPPSDLTRVFERFYKVDRARTRKGEGSGLGLAISRHLVEAHGGRIWAEASPRGGTTFGFTLPTGGRAQDRG